MGTSNLLVEAFQTNLQNKQYRLAEDVLKYLPPIVANELRAMIEKNKSKIVDPKNESGQELANSSINWENHKNFGVDGRCFVCGKPFSREESKMIGVGPVCGDWAYSFDPKDPKNRELLDQVIKTVRKRVLDNKTQFLDILHKIEGIEGIKPKILITRETQKAIMIDVNGKYQSWIPKKACVYFYGAFFVKNWKAKEILEEYKN